ncbi:ABC transporter substrate-binding protein [Novosphingobium panipatense]|uniref:ABC transporter substrate-binding protein n=1 Tax=Novosphingobium panipatense TaxID=428991 RepID=UPI0024B63BCC|nr:ABC transporter substrate-binding protein [Novosphingobium panipatense]
MRSGALFAGLLLAALPVSVGSAERAGSSASHRPRPLRVMSMNQCADQLVLALLPPERIASVTWLSRDPDGSLMHREAQKVAINHGLSEEVVQQQPDLVVAGAFTTPATRMLLRRLGYPMIEVAHADSFDEIRTITRQVAAAVGEEARGEALIARMDHQLSQLARQSGPAIQVAAWDGAGFNASEGSLYNAVLEAAGAVNVANRPPASTYGRPDVEVLLAAAPTLLVKGAGTGRRAGLQDNVERHRLVQRYWDGARTLTVRQSYYVCGTPFVADAISGLRGELQAAARQVQAPLPFAAGKTL